MLKREAGKPKMYTSEPEMFAGKLGQRKEQPVEPKQQDH